MKQKPSLGEFSKDKTLILRPIMNGGWVVDCESDMGRYNPPLGAFTTTEDMMVALSDALLTDGRVDQSPTPQAAP